MDKGVLRVTLSNHRQNVVLFLPLYYIWSTFNTVKFNFALIVIFFFFFFSSVVNEITRMPITMLEKIIINRRKCPNRVTTHSLVIRISNHPKIRRNLTVARWNCSGVDCNKYLPFGAAATVETSLVPVFSSSLLFSPLLSPTSPRMTWHPSVLA